VLARRVGVLLGSRFARAGWAAPVGRGRRRGDRPPGTASSRGSTTAGHDGGESIRRTEPALLGVVGTPLVRVSWDVDRAEWGSFRVDRMRPRIPGRSAVRSPWSGERDNRGQVTRQP